MRNEIDIAWAGGLFEGEGCFSSHKVGKYYGNPSASLGMTDEDSVRRFHAVVGLGRVRYENRAKRGWKDYWVWSCSSIEDVEIVVGLLYPYLGKRRQGRAMEVLYLAWARPGKAKDQTHCKRGHPFDAANTYITPEHRRVCKTCSNAGSRRYRERQREGVN